MSVVDWDLARELSGIRIYGEPNLKNTFVGKPAGYFICHIDDSNKKTAREIFDRLEPCEGSIHSSIDIENPDEKFEKWVEIVNSKLVGPPETECAEALYGSMMFNFVRYTEYHEYQNKYYFDLPHQTVPFNANNVIQLSFNTLYKLLKSDLPRKTIRHHLMNSGICGRAMYRAGFYKNITTAEIEDKYIDQVSHDYRKFIRMHTLYDEVYWTLAKTIEIGF